MITSKSLRWSGATISNGRQRLTIPPRGNRFYSITSSTTSLSELPPKRSRQRTICRPPLGQLRSISLWGWGSSSSSDVDFAKVHTAEGALGHDGRVLAQQATSPSQPIPAVHQTSDLAPGKSFTTDPQPTRPDVTFNPLDQFVSTPEEAPASNALDPVEALSGIPERIGYLKEVCGIDFGWGPSSIMQMLIEHIHIYGGFTWATSIVLMALTARVLIFLPMVTSSDQGAKWKASQSVIGPAREKLTAAYKVKDYRRMAEAKAELSALQKEYGVNPIKMFIPVLIQVPLQFGGFRVLRNMAELPVPALLKENWLWAQDLTLGDPFYILPVANAAVLYLTIKRGGESGTTQLQGGLMTILSYVMPAASFLFMTFQPGAVQLYFFTSALLAFAQSRLLTNNTFRRLMNLHPTVPTPRKTTNTIPAPSVGSNNTPAAPGTLTTTPGGLKLYQPPRPTTPYSSTAANPTRDVSIIDKFVDGAKAHKNQATEGWNNIMGTTKEKKVQQSRMESEKRRADEYDERMKREDQWRREQEREQERENGYVETGKRKEGTEEKTPTPGKVPKGRKRGQKIRR